MTFLYITCNTTKHVPTHFMAGIPTENKAKMRFQNYGMSDSFFSK